MNRAKIVTCIIATSLSPVSAVFAQEQPVEKPPAEIREVRVAAATAPGGSQWTKLLVDFQSTPKWIDGMQIAVTALCGDGSKDRPYSVLTGLARYINVPGGKNTGVLFISPKTTARYGGVTAVKAALYLNDRVVSSGEWKGGANAPENWQTVYDRRDGALLPITATPWLVSEYDKYPDTLAGR